MLRIFLIIINNILINGKMVSSEKLLKYLVKEFIKTNLKPIYKLFKLLISYLSFIFRFNITNSQHLNYKFLLVLEYRTLFGLKFLLSNIKSRIKQNLLLNINKLLVQKKLIYIKIFEYKKLLVFYRW
jgi:hypothetical protein